MKRFIKTLICLFLVAVVSVSLIGCKKGSGGVGEEIKSKYPATFDEAGNYTGGRHIREKSESTYDFITNRRTDYVGLLPSSSSKDLNDAFGEFNKFLKESTGLNLSKTTENSVEPGQKYISFGATAQLAAAMAAGQVEVPGFKAVDGAVVKDENAERPLRSNGFVIKTVGENIYVMGGEDIGVIFGAYQLANIMFNYTQYNVDIFYVDKDVKDLKLPNVHYVEDPDIAERIATWGSFYYKRTEAHRLGYRIQYDELLISEYHNSFLFLPPSEYQAEHPEWYNAGASQLCYTAHGDKESYDLMVATAAENMWKKIKEEPTKNHITFTQQDITTWCECEDKNEHDGLAACRDTINDYNGTSMSTQFFFANDLCKKIEEYRAAEQPDRAPIIVHIFAYHKTIAAPVEPEKVNGEWIPADGSRGKAIGHPNLSIYMAIYGAQNYQRPMEDPTNNSARALIEQYSTISNHLSFWPYTTYFDNFFVPFDSYTTNQNHFKYYAAANCELLLNQGQNKNNAATGFSELKAFLFGKWGWDVNLEYNPMVDAFFENVYGSKDGIMRKMYEEIRAYNMWRIDQNIVGSSIYGSGAGSNTFPTQMLFQWLDYCEQAIEEIAPFKDSDPTRYEAMRKAITLESLMPRYFLAKYHINLFPMEERAPFRAAFKADCIYTGLNAEDETVTLYDAIDNW